jgi:hypothetical protein
MQERRDLLGPSAAAGVSSASMRRGGQSPSTGRRRRERPRARRGPSGSIRASWDPRPTSWRRVIVGPDQAACTTATDHCRNFGGDRGQLPSMDEWRYNFDDDTAELLAVIEEHLRPGFTFVNIGANDGVLNDPCWPFIDRFGWSGVCVEPVPLIFERLAANYADLPQVQLVQAANLPIEAGLLVRGERRLRHGPGRFVRPDARCLLRRQRRALPCDRGALPHRGTADRARGRDPEAGNDRVARRRVASRSPSWRNVAASTESTW